MPIPPVPALRESLSPGDVGHIADHEAIHEALNNDTASLSGPNNFAGAQTFIGAVADNGGANVGTYAQMVAIVAPANGRRFYVEDHWTLYRYDAALARWVPLNQEQGVYNVLAEGADYGPVALATPATDSWDAFVAAMQKAAQNDDAGGPGIVLVPPGRYKVDGELLWSAMGLSDVFGRTVRMVGFGAGQTGLCSFIDFLGNTGFHPDFYGAALSAKGIYAQTSAAGGPVLHSESGFNMVFDDVNFGTASTTAPAVLLHECFTTDWYNSSFGCPAAGVANVLIEDVQAWYHRFRSCILNFKGILHELSTAHSTVTGEGILVEDTFSEQFTDEPIYKISVPAAVATTVKLPTIRRCYHQDAAGACDILLLDAVAGATLTANGGIIEDCGVGTGYHIHTTGAGTVSPGGLALLGIVNPKALYAAASGNAQLASIAGSIDVRSKQAGNTASKGRVVGDAADRYLRTVGDEEYFGGDGTALTNCVQRLSGTGTPEGVKTAPVGSTYHRKDGGAGTSFYVKESGAGNTGWVGK